MGTVWIHCPSMSRQSRDREIIPWHATLDSDAMKWSFIVCDNRDYLDSSPRDLGLNPLSFTPESGHFSASSGADTGQDPALVKRHGQNMARGRQAEVKGVGNTGRRHLKTYPEHEPN